MSGQLPSKSSRYLPALAAALGLAVGGPLARAADVAAAPPSGAVTVLDNERVHVERVDIPPGASVLPATGGSDQLVVFIHGGLLRSQDSGRTVAWRDGRVCWRAAGAPPEAASRNVGSTPIVMVRVSLKPVTAVAAAAARAGWPPAVPLSYPNIPGEDLLTNDAVFVQRFLVQPGQWEGVHAHPPNMLYIHVRGGQWAARSRTEREHQYPAPTPDGGVGWMATIPLSEGHESGNAGKEPIDLIWVTLRK